VRERRGENYTSVDLTQARIHRDLSETMMTDSFFVIRKITRPENDPKEKDPTLMNRIYPLQ